MATECRRRLTPEQRLVVGLAVDDQTRCAHYHTDRDVIAIRFPCCETYYPCFECHAACVDHDAVQWPRNRVDEPAILCGVCGTELTVQRYLDCEHQCPDCGTAFNPGCRRHADRYFAVDETATTDSDR